MLTQHPALFSFSPSPVGRLRVHKNLGGTQDGRDNPRYMASSSGYKAGEGEGEGGTFRGMQFVLPNLWQSPAFLGWLNICLPTWNGEQSLCSALLADMAFDLPSLSQPVSFSLLLLLFSAQSWCWGRQGGAGWFFAAGWGEITAQMHHKPWQRGTPVPTNTLILVWGLLQEVQMCSLPTLVLTAVFGPWAGVSPVSAAHSWAPLLLLMREEPCSLCLLYCLWQRRNSLSGIKSPPCP